MLWDKFAILDSLRRTTNVERQRHRNYAQKWRTERLTRLLHDEGKSFEGNLKDDEGEIVQLNPAPTDFKGPKKSVVGGILLKAGFNYILYRNLLPVQGVY